MSKKISREVFNGYRDEVRGYLPVVRTALSTFRSDDTCMAELEEARRQVHSIKSTSAMVHMAPLGHVAHEMEQIFEALESKTLRYISDMQSVWFIKTGSQDCRGRKETRYLRSGRN